MNKIVAVAAGGSLAESIVGAELVPARERWNPGSLVGAALSKISAATIVALSHNRLLVFQPDSGTPADGKWTEIENAILSDYPTSFVPLAVGDGSVKSRPLVLTEVGGTPIPVSVAPVGFGTLPVTNSDLISLCEDLVTPAPPSFSASSLASKVDAYFQNREVPLNYALLLNQFNGKAFIVASAPGHEVSDGLLSSFSGGAVADFSLTVPAAVVDPEAPVPPVWG